MPDNQNDTAQIEQIQTLLNQRGFPVAVDGVLGSQTTAAIKAFQSTHLDQSGRPLVSDGVVGPLTLASLQNPPSVAAASFPGFDTAIFPGLNQMRIWKNASPYQYAGYYLKAPCVASFSWMGQRQALAALGWNLIAVYVGQQESSQICPRTNLTSSQGVIDANDAASRATADGFAQGTSIYLDVERVDNIGAAWVNYIGSWVSQLLQTPYQPAVYCHKFNALGVRQAVLGAFSAGSNPAPRFWIVGSGSPAFNLQASRPADVGIDFADMWQCPSSVTRTFGGVSINIDENVSVRVDP
jgi:peptidoglycan hydrolase-like protein with peptidoglycan-binding domain